MKVVCCSKLVSCSLFDIFSANSSELFSLTIYGNSAMIIVYALIGIRLWIGLNPLVTGTEEGEMAPAITSLQNYFKSKATNLCKSKIFGKFSGTTPSVVSSVADRI